MQLYWAYPQQRDVTFRFCFILFVFINKMIIPLKVIANIRSLSLSTPHLSDELLLQVPLMALVESCLAIYNLEANNKAYLSLLLAVQ